VLPKVGDGVNGRFVCYRNLTLNHSLAPNNPRPSSGSERQRPREPAQRPVEVGGQEADSEELEGVPEKQMVETLQPLSQDLSEPLKAAPSKGHRL